jgi:hypothetical protein
VPLFGLSAIKQNRPFGSIFGSNLQFSPQGAVGRHEAREAIAPKGIIGVRKLGQPGKVV